MKKVLVCTDGSSFADSCYQYAAWLASRLEANVDVLYVTDLRSQQAISTDNLSGTIGFDASRELLDKLVDIEHEKAKLDRQKSQLILQAARQFFVDRDITTVNLIHETGFLVDSLQQLETDADLIILGKRGENAQFASAHLGANVERIVRASHKPCLVTPANFQPIERVLLAYDGSKSCEQMLQFLLASPAFRGLTLHILSVTKTSEFEAAQIKLHQVAEKARAVGFSPIVQVSQGDTEKIIEQYIRERNIHLLLMGAYGHSRIRHLVIGSTTAQMLRNSPIPVLLFR